MEDEYMPSMKVADEGLVALPAHILVSVFCMLDVRSLASLCATCKATRILSSDNIVWHAKLSERFSQHLLQQIGLRLSTRPSSYMDSATKIEVSYLSLRPRDLCCFKDLYTKLVTCRRSALTSEWTCQAWGQLNTRLMSEPESSSAHGCVAVLYDLYLRQLSTTFHDVLPGRYRIVWRMKLDDVSLGSPTTFHAAMVNQPGSSTMEEQKEQRHTAGFTLRSGAVVHDTIEDGRPRDVASLTQGLLGQPVACAHPAADASLGEGSGSSTDTAPAITSSTSRWDPDHWRAMEKLHGNCQWFDAVVGELHLPTRCSVGVALHNLDVEWKSNIWLDDVSLRPVV